MLVLITYDVRTDTREGRSRLRHVARICQDYGIRVQKSVFECRVNPADRIILEDKLRHEIDNELDSVRIYDLGATSPSKITHIGAKEFIDLNSPLIF